jgi:glycosyltransferase involved in cell wall biosynthesis
MRLLVVKAAMTVNGGAARDLLRNLSAISEKFEVRFLCLNLLQEQLIRLQTLGIETICPDEQWEPVGGLWNEITAGQERSALSTWKSVNGVREAIDWAEAIHLTGGNGSMEFLKLVPKEKLLHLHFLEAKPGIHEGINHLKPDGTGTWRPHILHFLQKFQRRRIEKSFQSFIDNENWIISANSNFSASKLESIYKISGGVLYPSVDLSEFPKDGGIGEEEVFKKIIQYPKHSYVVTIGRISRFKGTYEVVDHVKGSGLNLVVIGGSSIEERKSLNDYGEEYDIEVRVLSRLSSEEMCSVMRNAAAIVGLAHGEAFGLTPIEAMALGVPPIFVNEGGFCETIIDGENGRLIDRGKYDQWTEALVQAKNIDIREKWARSGIERIEQLGLTPENHSIRLYEEIMRIY